jgi:hypothetical protein
VVIDSADQWPRPFNPGQGMLINRSGPVNERRKYLFDFVMSELAFHIPLQKHHRGGVLVRYAQRERD